MDNVRRNQALPKSQARPDKASGFVLVVLFLAASLAAGCSGVTATIQSTNPPPQTQTYSISGTVAPAAGGSGATVTLGGATTTKITADSSGNYTFIGLTAGAYVVTPSNTGYTFNPSSQSVTLSAADVTAIDFNAVPLQPHSAVLSWAASSPGTGVVGYDVYRGTTEGGPYILLNSSPVQGVTYTDTTVQSGQTYFYVTVAVDSSGNQSVYSNQVQAVIP